MSLPASDMRLDRVRRLLADKQGWLDHEEAGRHPLRLGTDRRARVILWLDTAEFAALARDPGLSPRPGGGWRRARTAGPTPGTPTPPGGPGRIEAICTRLVPEGGQSQVRVNLGDSAIAWLARRRDRAGHPWLSPVEVAAGLQLTREAEQALKGPSLTQRWDALPRSGKGTSARVEPGTSALAAARRVEAARQAAGPHLWPMLEAVCVRGSALQAAETGLGLRRRHGKTMLKQGLQALARHYGIG